MVKTWKHGKHISFVKTYKTSAHFWKRGVAGFCNTGAWPTSRVSPVGFLNPRLVGVPDRVKILSIECSRPGASPFLESMPHPLFFFHQLKTVSWSFIMHSADFDLSSGEQTVWLFTDWSSLELMCGWLVTPSNPLSLFCRCSQGGASSS